MAVHVRYKSLYISLPSAAKQQREMIKFCVVWRTLTTTAIFLNFSFKFIVASPDLGCDDSTATFVGTEKKSFFNRRFPRRRCRSYLNSLLCVPSGGRHDGKTASMCLATAKKEYMRD